MPKKPNELNQFQYFLRGADAVKSATAMTLTNQKDSGRERKNNLIYAGSLQVSFGLLTLVGLVGRVLEEPGRMRTNAIGLLLRSGIILMDLASGVLLLSDPEEKTAYSLVGMSLMTCSIFASRLVGEDGHHNQEGDEENDEERRSLQKGTSKSSIQGYGSSGN